METTDLEKQSLEAHVDLCALRYENLDKRLNNVEKKIENLGELLKDGNSALIKVLIGSAGSIIAGILSIIVVILMN